MVIRDTFRFQLLGLAPPLCDIKLGIQTPKKGVCTLKTACVPGSVGFIVHNLYGLICANCSSQSTGWL